MPVHVAESPLTCVAVGSGRSLEEFEAIHRSARARARRNGETAATSGALCPCADSTRRTLAGERPRGALRPKPLHIGRCRGTEQHGSPELGDSVPATSGRIPRPETPGPARRRLVAGLHCRLSLDLGADLVPRGRRRPRHERPERRRGGSDALPGRRRANCRALPRRLPAAPRSDRSTAGAARLEKENEALGSRSSRTRLAAAENEKLRETLALHEMVPLPGGLQPSRLDRGSHGGRERSSSRSWSRRARTKAWGRRPGRDAGQARRQGDEGLSSLAGRPPDRRSRAVCRWISRPTAWHGAPGFGTRAPSDSIGCRRRSMSTSGTWSSRPGGATEGSRRSTRRGIRIGRVTRSGARHRPVQAGRCRRSSTSPRSEAVIVRIPKKE